MQKLNRPARRYLRQIRGWLPCAGSMKRKMLAEIRETLLEFLADHPDADEQAIVSRFGAPQQIASSYVEEAETGELLRKLRIRRRVVSIACAAAVACVAIWAGAVIYMVNSDAHQVKDPVVYIEITEDEWVPYEGGK